MPSDRNRILELALESLQNKKKQLDAEIAEITHELKGGTGKQGRAATRETGTVSSRKRPRFSKEEKLRRSQRMKEYWENWRKKKNRKQ